MIYWGAVSFATGILISNFLPTNIFTTIFFIIVLFLASNFLSSKKIRTVFLICVLFFSIGVIRNYFSENKIDKLLSTKVGEEVLIVGKIITEPDQRDDSTRYTLQAERVGKNNLKNKNKILIVADRFPKLSYGDMVELRGKIEYPKNFTTDLGVEFDYISYLKSDGVVFLTYRPQIKLLEEGHGNFIKQILIKLKNKNIENIKEVIPEPEASFISGTLFGGKQSLGQELLDNFKKAGLVHIIVLSGYNLTIIATAIMGFTERFSRRSLGIWISFLSLVIFSVMVGLGATILRALFMASIGLLATYLGRRYEALRALSIAFIVMVFWNPKILLSDPSFQLSFMATLGLILISPIIENFISKKIPGLYKHKNIREIIASTLAVQVFILPLIIKMSGMVSVISFITNIVVLPFIPIVMLFGFITSSLGFISYYLSWPFGVVAYVFAKMIIIITNASASLPISILKTGSIPIWVVILWYTSYVLIYKYKIQRKE